MNLMTFGRRGRRVEPDPDLVAEGFGEIAAELRDYAARTPASSVDLASRVVTALAIERQRVARPGTLPLFQRLTAGLRPASFRSLLAAALLVAAVGAGVALAAAGALPFHFPTLVPAEVPAPHVPRGPIVLDEDDGGAGEPVEPAPTATNVVDVDDDADGVDGDPDDPTGPDGEDDEPDGDDDESDGDDDEAEDGDDTDDEDGEDADDEDEAEDDETDGDPDDHDETEDDETESDPDDGSPDERSSEADGADETGEPED